MSSTSVETILTRAMSDNAFANRLFSNPEKAMAGFDLTAEEIANLKGITRAEFDKFAMSSPEERKSFGYGNHNQTILRVK